VEEQGLPALREDAQEEEAEGDFEGGGGEDVEDFAELDVLCGLLVDDFVVNDIYSNVRSV
jgi:hypothetical protein